MWSLWSQTWEMTNLENYLRQMGGWSWNNGVCVNKKKLCSMLQCLSFFMSCCNLQFVPPKKISLTSVGILTHKHTHDGNVQSASKGGDAFSWAVCFYRLTLRPTEGKVVVDASREQKGSFCKETTLRDLCNHGSCCWVAHRHGPDERGVYFQHFVPVLDNGGWKNKVLCWKTRGQELP